MANKIYQNPEATIWFVPAAAAQAATEPFEIHNLASAAGRMSDPIDRGTNARPAEFAWCAFCQWATPAVLKQTIDVYLKYMGTSASATAHPTNDDGVAEGAVSAIDKLSNLDYLGSIVVDQAAQDIATVARGTVHITARGYQVVFWNASDDALTNDVDENGFFLTPVPDEIQD